MKKLLLFCALLLSTTFSFSQFSHEKFKEFKRELPKGVKASQDKFEGIVWIKTNALSYGGYDKFRAYFYIGINSSGVFLRYVSEYRGANWLFIDEQSYLFGNKNKTQTLFKFKFDESNRTVLGSAGIKEKSDIIVTGELSKMFYFLQNTEDKTFIVKLSGDKKYSVTGGFVKKFKTHAKLINEAYKYARVFYDKIYNNKVNEI